MERTQYDGQHQYLVTPPEYPISANENHSTYDQFIQLRDTLIFTGKYYNDKAGKRLIVGDKGDGTTSNTIEVFEINYFRQGFQPNWATGGFTTKVLPEPSGKYVTSVPAQLIADYGFGNLCCMIQKDGHYRILHKEEVLPTATTNKVYCYVDVYRKVIENDVEVYKIPQDMRGGIAVFDRECNASLSGTTSGTDPNGSCTVPITLGKIFKKVTAMSYMEKDLKKGDILVLRMKDAECDPSTGEPTGNDLTIQNDSNYWSIEYLDLPYNI